ncbi:MAG TPA: threonine synthase [Deltaproteobacteria bacterium]|nr:MAG: threonine synthase [Deltaproteobacteria bacterium GWA2_45_12]HBF12676.1 threonine synthase [Deltaproteobacteria bacterium]
MSYVKALKCRECGHEYPKQPTHVCEFCFGPLEVVYDYEGIKKILTKELIGSRGPNMWRYKELLPIDNDPTVGKQVGFTPLRRASRLARLLGVSELYIKNDAVNYPTLSFKDRVVSVALSKAKEFGFKVVACASTGNLANSVAANAAAADLESFVFVPYDLEATKILGTMIYGTNLIGIHGTYDEVNRLCSEIAGKYKWAFVNINMRPYYAEGSKSMGYEIVEQLGWNTPKHVVVPMASGSLLTKIDKSFQEFHKIGLLKTNEAKIYGAQATGCSPISTAVKNNWDIFKPVKPNTIAKSLAIGNPADGFYAAKTVHQTGGWCEDVSDEEVIAGIRVLAETEGIFAETAGGVTVGVAKKLIEQGRIPKNESIVLCITGNGLKTQEAVRLGKPPVIKPSLTEFDALVKDKIK